MKNTEKILQIDASHPFHQTLQKGLKFYLESKSIEDSEKKELMTILREQAVSKAKWELRCFMRDADRGGSEYEGSFHGGVNEEEFYYRIGKMVVELAPFNVTLQEVDPDIFNKISMAIRTYHSVTARQHFAALSNTYSKSDTAAYYVEKIHYHLEKACMSVEECLHITEDELKDAEEKYNQTRIENLPHSEEYIEEEIAELQQTLREIRALKQKNK